MSGIRILCLSDDEVADLVDAVQCWLNEYSGAAPEQDIKRMERLEKTLIFDSKVEEDR